MAVMSTPAWIWENFFRHVSPFIYTMLIVSLFPAFSRSARRRFVAKTAKILAGSRIAPDFVSPPAREVLPRPPVFPPAPSPPYPNIFCGALPRKKRFQHPPIPIFFARTCALQKIPLAAQVTSPQTGRAARQQERAARIAHNSSSPFRTRPLGIGRPLGLPSQFTIPLAVKG